MAKVKTDWQKHCKIFLNGDDLSTDGARAYCEHKLLAFNTFRVRLAAFKKTDAFKRHVAQKTPAAQIKKKLSSGGVSAKRAKKAPPESKLAKIPRTHAVIAKPEHSQVESNGLGGFKFKKRHSASTIHGKHRQVSFTDKGTEERAQSPLDDIITLLRARNDLVNTLIVEKLKDIDDRYDNDEPITIKRMSNDGKWIEVELERAEAKYEANKDPSLAMCELTKTIIAGEKTLHDLAKSEFELDLKAFTAPRLSTNEAHVIKLEILDQYKAGLPLRDTLMEFERVGVPAPALLMREYDNELRLAEPPEAEGITAMERVGVTKKMQEIRASKDEWLANQADLNKAIYSEFLGLGDEHVTNMPDLNNLIQRENEE